MIPLVIIRDDEPVPRVSAVNPPNATAGKDIIVSGENLDLVSEVYLRSTQDLSVVDAQAISPEMVSKTSLTVNIDINQDSGSYVLELKENDKEPISTGHLITVNPVTMSPDSTPEPTPTPSPPNPTPTPTPTPTSTPTPTWTCETLESEESTQFFPLAIASDTEGNVYVLDSKVVTKEYRVRKFNINDNNPIIWDLNVEDLDSALNAPKGIAVELRDGNTLIYVADTGSNVVRLLRVEGNEDQEKIFQELLSNLVEIPFQANCRSVRRSRHPVDLATL